MKVYEHRIDICLNPANRDAFWRDKDVKDTPMPTREHYFTPAAIGAANGGNVEGRREFDTTYPNPRIPLPEDIAEGIDARIFTVMVLAE